jgi:hypothetical protein
VVPGIAASLSSFLLALPAWWVLLSNKPTDQVSSFDHTVAVLGLVLLPFAALFALFGVGYSVFARRDRVGKRLAAAGLALPALIGAGVVVFILSNIPPT